MKLCVLATQVGSNPGDLPREPIEPPWYEHPLHKGIFLMMCGRQVAGYLIRV